MYDRHAAFLLDVLGAPEDGATLLDVGCSVGRFMGKALERGWSPVGVEPDASTLKVAQEAGFSAHLGTIESFESDARFDAVTSFHVIEHTSSTRDFLAACNRHLKVGGRVIIETPNTASWSERVLKERAWPWYAPEHSNLLSRDELVRELERAGFAIVEVRTYDSAFRARVMRRPSTWRKRFRRTPHPAASPSTTSVQAVARERERGRVLRFIDQEFVPALTAPVAWVAGAFGAGSEVLVTARKVREV